MTDFELPTTKHLALRLERSILHLTLNRPEVRNAMSFAMVEEIIAVFDALADQSEVRVVVIRGAGGHFCAGGDIKDMAAARMAPAPEQIGGPDDPMAVGNRKFGTMLSVIETAPQAVVAVIEGAVMGGGFGLACVADVSLARADAKFRLPETSLGIPPAQIAAFIVRRIGLTQARRLAVTGGRLDGRQAREIGIVHEVYDDDEALETGLATTLAQIRRCAPGAVAVTKDLVISSLSENIEVLLDRAAKDFAVAIRGPEGQEGTMAFIEKRDPAWARDDA
ncbi:2,3-dehydroadipyl-CoA hydratase [Enhygromyxa salina]|uniref:2,3-dehydroadipyl-CoA hydratase n=1 Tax=Enhygromyxa salina TaxID=215803 RepID=A0A2S9YBS1_9BACT|nr:enoyl-CoA hydratase/isomerase family protein [Enhygromyxa salina]PRQ02567.1 2,3-dehydroadipyl-CoA hydratase [Enhygromyxa salina]